MPRAQERLYQATRTALAAIAVDVRQGLSETVGIDATWVEGERASVRLSLPPETDTDYIAQAIDAENVAAWCDSEGRVHVALAPWYSMKDTDQMILAITKVIHVLLGLHAVEVEEHSHPPK